MHCNIERYDGERSSDAADGRYVQARLAGGIHDANSACSVFVVFAPPAVFPVSSPALCCRPTVTHRATFGCCAVLL